MRIAALLALLAVAGCRENKADDAVSTTTVTGAELPRIATMGEAGGRVVVLPASTTSKRAVVYLHDACIDPKTDVDAWGTWVRTEGTILAPDGDASCPDGTSTWSEDAASIDRRIQSALDQSKSIDPKGVVLVGSGIGAARVELLAKRFPDRYARFVLIGGPAAPSVDAFKNARAVATLAGDDEPLVAMQDGSRVLDRAGIPSQHWTMPLAAHGAYGKSGPEMLQRAVRFVALP